MAAGVERDWKKRTVVSEMPSFRRRSTARSPFKKKGKTQLLLLVREEGEALI